MGVPKYLTMTDSELHLELAAVRRVMAKAKARGMVRGVKACRQYLRDLTLEGNRRVESYRVASVKLT